jgi:hypothetical protein
MSFRVIYHAPVCPDCGSGDISTEDVETGGGLTETAHICQSCGTAWPVACISDWTTPNHPVERRTSHDQH